MDGNDQILLPANPLAANECFAHPEAMSATLSRLRNKRLDVNIMYGNDEMLLSAKPRAATNVAHPEDVCDPTPLTKQAA